MREDFELRNSALINLYPQIVSMRHVETENESFLDSSGNEVTISNEKVEEEIIKLKAEHDAQEYARNRATEYPAIADQLDEIYHNGIDSWKAVIKVTKDKYPKG